MPAAILRENVIRPGKQCAEPTLSELLSDPIIKAIMKADGVTPREIKDLMRRAIIAQE
jgi:hypothetical protein